MNRRLAVFKKDGDFYFRNGKKIKIDDYEFVRKNYYAHKEEKIDPSRLEEIMRNAEDDSEEEELSELELELDSELELLLDSLELEDD